MNKNKLFFNNLSTEATPLQLMNLFSLFGKVKDLRLLRDPVFLRSVGKGSVEMKNFHGAVKCIEKLNGFLFMGRKISINWSRGAFAGA